jgi:hypothetical protein
MSGDGVASQLGAAAQRRSDGHKAYSLLQTGSTGTTGSRTNSKHKRNAGSLSNAAAAGEQAALAEPSTSSSTASQLSVSNIKLAAAAATADESRNMVAALVHTLFKHGLGGYAVGMMQQHQQEKLALLSRLNEADLAAVLAAPQPQQVLDAVYEMQQRHTSV